MSDNGNSAAVFGWPPGPRLYTFIRGTRILERDQSFRQRPELRHLKQTNTTHSTEGKFLAEVVLQRVISYNMLR